MLKIGEFSRLTQVPAKTLRYYDEIGLFKPAQVDKFTGYRYYTIAQLPRLYRIMALKALDLTLEQIQHMLDDDLSPEEMRGMLRLKQAELNQTIADVQMRLSYVAHKIQQVEEEETFMAKYEVILKDVPELKVAITEGIAPDMARLSYTLSTMFQSVAEYLNTQAVAPVGPAFAMYLDDEMMETNIRIATAFPIADNIT
ncbi:MAG: helix-turn-helix domain-containing protein, partial [Chloroflexota bacterium]